MENLKEEVNKLLKLTGVNNKDELLDKLIAIFDRERKKYALEMCKETIYSIENNFRTFEELDTAECIEQFIPSELQPGGENEK